MTIRVGMGMPILKGRFEYGAEEGARSCWPDAAGVQHADLAEESCSPEDSERSNLVDTEAASASVSTD